MTVELPFECAEDIMKVLDHFGLHAERSSEGLAVRGYRGAVGKQKAEIVVSREQFNGISDLAFYQDENGKWQMQVDGAASGMATDIKNVHAFLKVQDIVKRRRKKSKVSGEVPRRLQCGYHSGKRQEEICIEVYV
jgi:hypothetical protein